MKVKLLKDVACFVDDSISCNTLNSKNYIGVDNMLKNCAGVCMSEYVPSEGNATHFQAGDILIGNIRPYFKKIWLADKEGGASPDVLVIRKTTDEITSEYLYSCLSTQTFFNYDTAGAKGSKMPRGDKDHIMRYTIPLMDSQKRIGELVLNINSKISLNNSICSDLEAMAKQLYDYWFVQFDFPDENGKPYKSSGGKMVWNEELKREIPEGWKVGKFGDVISSINTGLNPRDNFKLNTGGNIKYLTVKNLTTSGNIDFSGCDTIDEDARKIVHRRSDIRIGDILFASISPLGRCHIIKEEPKEWDINESVFSIRPNYNKITSDFLYMTFMSEYFIKKAEGSSAGSVFKGIRITELQDLTTIIPPLIVLKEFDKTVDNIFNTKTNAFNENQTLTSFRDFLLPMLMNGQVKVR